jgi:3-phenylpropionate/trans-cinnamate dioxygenase ferredoxin reductase subunit
VHRGAMGRRVGPRAPWSRNAVGVPGPLRPLLAGASVLPLLQTKVDGGGFIGSELASTCRSLGLDVTVLSPLPLLATALGPLARAATARARRHGVEVVDDAVVTEIDVADGTSTVVLADGSTRRAEVVVVAIGAVPHVDWLEGSGATLVDGLVCDETLAAVGLPNVVAAGDVARWPHPALGGDLLRLEHWTNAAEQARAAARRLLNGPGAAFSAVPSFWSDQFGIRLQGVGLPGLADEATVVSGEPEGDVFVAEYRRGGVLVGAIAAGAPAALVPYRQKLAMRMRSAPSPRPSAFPGRAASPASAGRRGSASSSFPAVGSGA